MSEELPDDLPEVPEHLRRWLDQTLADKKNWEYHKKEIRDALGAFADLVRAQPPLSSEQTEIGEIAQRTAQETIADKTTPELIEILLTGQADETWADRLPYFKAVVGTIVNRSVEDRPKD